MINIWVLAASALALAAAARLASRRTRRRNASGEVSVPSVSEQWLAEQRSHTTEGL